MPKPYSELSSLQAFAEKNKFDKYKCLMTTISGSQSPTLTLVIPTTVTDKIRDAFYEHLKHYYQFYSLHICELSYFECIFRKKQLNVEHNNSTTHSWKG